MGLDRDASHVGLGITNQPLPTPDEINKEKDRLCLGVCIRELREAKGWKKKDLAKAVGMSQSRISIMERPDYDKYTFSSMKRLAEALDAEFIPILKKKEQPK